MNLCCQTADNFTRICLDKTTNLFVDPEHGKNWIINIMDKIKTFWSIDILQVKNFSILMLHNTPPRSVLLVCHPSTPAIRFLPHFFSSHPELPPSPLSIFLPLCLCFRIVETCYPCHRAGWYVFPQRVKNSAYLAFAAFFTCQFSPLHTFIHFSQAWTGF